MTYDHGFSSTKNLFGISTFTSIEEGSSNLIIEGLKKFPANLYKTTNLKINHSYLVEQFADYSRIFKQIEKVVRAECSYTVHGN